MNRSLSKTPRKLAVGSAFLAAAVLTIAGAALPAQAATSSVYDSIPVPYSASEASLGFGVTSTAELGQHVALAGSARVLETVSIGFTSWACESGAWNDDCESAEGATFDLPIALNVYAALPNSDDDGTLPGDVLATVTSTVAVPFRPEANSVDCDTAGWFVDTASEECVPGVAFIETFDLSSLDVTLPGDVIVSVAFDSAFEPGHSDALNVSLQTDGPSVGAQPDPDNLFWNNSNAAYYTDGGEGGVGVFRSDSGWGSTGLMLIRIDASAPDPVVPAVPVVPVAPKLAATGSVLDSGAAGAAGLLVLLGAGVLAASIRRRHARR